MWLGNGRQQRAGSVDGEVLAELRGIREEIRALSDRVANSATRADLEAYVTKETFQEHLSQGRRMADFWQRAAPTGIAAVALLWAIFGPHLHP